MDGATPGGRGVRTATRRRLLAGCDFTKMMSSSSAAAGFFAGSDDVDCTPPEVTLSASVGLTTSDTGVLLLEHTSLRSTPLVTAISSGPGDVIDAGTVVRGNMATAVVGQVSDVPNESGNSS
ncbi:hypothetical protein NP493_420g01014 [Ridgeia piscesae]|uniref:Uncharacterized protein n=1 Tax=Ridgeia piscesae TaxID=27915 RepID=A0AAD9L0Q1_RIDPI|nr:hypothetical protein NP493_420g01014 [Ridgeia piscesae]